MKRVLLTLSIAALVLPATTLGKGPSGASIDGPGSGRITFGGGRGSGLFTLTEQAGFFPAVFARQPDPMLGRRPTGDLGPKYTITYTVPGAEYGIDKLRQDVYPYAPGGPVTYMEPGQKIFGESTRGGWFQGSSGLKETLVAAGLPASPSSASGGSSSVPTIGISLLAAGLLLVATTAVLLRRRARPATA